MSNIVNLADHPRASADAESRTKRVEALRARVEAGYKLLATDQERIAENLYRLLSQLEKDGRIRRADLCRDVFQLHASSGPPTKRLETYALNPAKEGGKRRRQLGLLAKRAGNYVKLAEEAARRAGENVDTVLLNLVHGTALARTETLPPEDPMTKDLKAPLIRSLERAAAKVVSETGLQRTFQLIARYPERVANPWGDATDLNDIVVAGPINETLLHLEDGSTSPPPGHHEQDWRRLVGNAPAVMLGEVIIDRVEVEPQVESTTIGLRREKDPHNSFGRAKLLKKEIKRPEGEHWSAVTEYRVRVWLALLPFGPSHDPRLGLHLELLRHVKIEHARAPSGLPLPLPEGASPEQRVLHDMQQKAHEMLKRHDDCRTPETILSKRFLNLSQRAVWNSWREGFRVKVPVDLAPIEPWLDLLLGRKLYDGEASPARMLAFNSEEAQRLLDLPDCGEISDWVGPRPDIDYSGIRLGPEPSVDDPSQWEQWEDWRLARQEARDRNRAYRFRFAGTQEPDQPERYPMSWKTGTLGYKLERSLLEVEGEDGVIQQLRSEAERLVAEVQNKIGAALSAREERLARLHLSSSGED